MGRVIAPAMHDVPVESPVVVSFTPSARAASAIPPSRSKPPSNLSKKGKSNKSAKVALVDLDFQSSHVCDYLDIAPKFQFEEIVGSPDRLDDHLLSAFISHHSSGLDVLAASRSRFHARDLSVEALSALFDVHRRNVTPPSSSTCPLSVHPWTLPRARGVEGNLGHRAQHHSGLAADRGNASSLAHRGVRHAELRALVNRCEFGLLGSVARGDHVSRILGEEKRFLVRNARVAIECVNVGAPISLAHPSDKSVKDIAAIAAFCVGLNATPFRRR